VQGARLAGAEVIACVDPLPARREEALRLGATHACAPEELESLTRELTGDGFDVALDAVGHPETTALALQRVRPLGLACAVGMPAAGARLDIDPAEFTVREKRLTGSLYGSDDPALALPALLAHVAAGRLELASLLGPTYPLERIDEAVADALAGNPKRVLVVPTAA
jgi:Zn-dependent alcohol dehydrogenase